MTVQTQQHLMAVAAFKEVNGYEFGVLKDGTPFVSSRALAKMCGVAPSTIIQLTDAWGEEVHKPRGLKIAEYIQRLGGDDTTLTLNTERNINAHPEYVVLALLEYYAFDIKKDAAVTNFRALARMGFRELVYGATGYRDPIDLAWGYFKELKLNNTPQPGYFDVFNEISQLIISAIQSGLPISSATVPDVSVGQTWARHWHDNCLHETHGERLRMEHKYPADYPQSQVMIEKWIYPAGALGAFRVWFESVYLPSKFPKYLQGKVKTGKIGEEEYNRICSEFLADFLPPGEEE